MPDQLQFRRGTSAENDAFTGADGEITIDSETGAVRTHDNATPGGVAQLVATDLTAEVLGRVGENLFINGEFDAVRPGAGAGVGDGVIALNDAFCFERWRADDGNDGRMILTPGQFPVGEKLDGVSTKLFHRMDFPTIAAAITAATLEQRIESVRTIDDETVTVSFWAAGTLGGTFSLDLVQDYGDTGDVSDTTPMGTFVLTGTMTKHTFSLVVPSLAGKGISGGNDYVAVRFTLPLSQTGTFDLAQAKAEKGTEATRFVSRPQALTETLCEKFFQRINTGFTFYTGALSTWRWWTGFSKMRTAPSLSVNVTQGTVTSVGVTASGVEFQHGSAPAGNHTSRAQVELDAEL